MAHCSIRLPGPPLGLADSTVSRKLRDGQSLPGYYLIRNIVTHLRLVAADRRAQDTVEYALMAGFVAVAIGAVFPDLSEEVDEIFKRLCELMKKTAKV